jgi:hypothetical protein
MYSSPYSTSDITATDAQKTNSYIRLFNASPNSTALDIYANDTFIAQNIGYKQLTQYIPTPTGNYTMNVYPVGEDTNPLLNAEVYIPPNTIFNLAIIDKYPYLSLYTIPEPVSAQNFGRSCIRFINLSPKSPNLDVLMPNGTKIFNSVGYKYISDYACIPSGTNNFGIVPVGAKNILLATSNVQLNPNNYYTIYALGQNPNNFPSEIVMVPEPR